MLAARMAIPSLAASAASRDAQENLIDSAEFAAARVVALYAPIRNEVDTGEVFRVALQSGKIVLFPAVDGENLNFREVTGPSDLRAGAFGIREPADFCRIVEPGEAELIVVPGVAFDSFGRRIGYGRGFYDRALHKSEGSGKLAGLCYQFQLVDEITGEPHDVVMDIIITDRQLIRVAKF